MSALPRPTTWRERWHAVRAPLLIAVAVVSTAIITVLIGGTDTSTPLDPRSAAPSGTRALDVLLREQGVQASRIESYDEARAAAPGGTILITDPADMPSQRVLDLIRTASATVLVDPGQSLLEELPGEVELRGPALTAALDPGCALPAAAMAGRSTLGGARYSAGPSAISCYDESLVVIPASAGNGTIIILGSADVLTNEHLGDEGNAALSMMLLGRHPALAWYLPSPTDPAFRTDEQSLVSLIPPGWWFAAAQVFVGVVLLAAWRARRLGPIVTEPLPVIIRATETHEGRARLYQRARDHAHAATVLRAATTHRAARALRLPRSTDDRTLAATIAARTGREPGAVTGLLHGPGPTDDSALLVLARELADLEHDLDLGRDTPEGTHP
ncbi:DUF4350 domain-containing protein [Lolliginicoccus suaedae]|uniref:DUF4350 domain-containing protein n=1 Tax=Lolliginicoccus suaedae TaxID=2605429 RepID=UPI0011F02954|nr:DUF4350 domain-containing protein [Lolliginicoccus suaedae]